ncbi:hypothetical protein [Halovenus sp. HT40]|uniref:hypothetical protein n=1 Tax=Halovenus sp. HT40 TaxID=3126691 RepID=UPI00300EA07A
MSDDEENPFEELDDAVGDRDGDPFETLGDESEDSPGDHSESSGEAADSGQREPETEQFRGAPDPRDPAEPGPETEQDTSEESLVERGLFAPDETDSEPQHSSADDDSPAASAEPVDDAEMAFDIGQREDADPTQEKFRSDAGRREGDPFDSFEDAFDEMDVDKLDPDVVWQQLASAESRGSVGDAQERTYADVSKHSYCEQCEHFSPPPDVSCGHEGTEIVEFLDMDTVRVVDCPIVTEREELEDDDGFGDA